MACVLYSAEWVQVILQLKGIESVKFNQSIANKILLPPIIRAATMMMGMAQLMPNSWPNISLPQMAPSLAATKVMAIAVDLRWVGKTSTPSNVDINQQS